MKGFPKVMRNMGPQFVNATLALHQKMTTNFLPTAVKFHYIFNLRDMTNIFQVSLLIQNLINY